MISTPLCIACDRELPAEPLFRSDWLRLPGGVLCPVHRRQMESAKPGQGFKLGNGIYLVKVADVTPKGDS